MVINPNNKISSQSDQQLLALLTVIGREVRVEKGLYLVKEGDRCDCFFYIVQGAFRAFRYVQDEEITIGFSFPGDIDTCPYAYQNDIASLDTIEALSDSRVLKIEKGKFQAAIADKAKLETTTSRLMSDYIEVLIRRIIDYKINTAEANYQKLYDRHPETVSRIPLMYIASYLGITPERLSRIRKKMTTT